MSTRPTPYHPDAWKGMPPPTLRMPDMEAEETGLRVCLPGPESTSSTARVVLAGDWAAVREFGDAGNAAPESLYGSLAGVIADADLSVVNLECPLGGDTPIVKDGPNFRCEPACASALVRAGFNVATLANNHIYDQGMEGLRATRRHCREAGLLTVGAGEDVESAMTPLFVEVGGLRLGLLALSEDCTLGRAAGGAAPMFDARVLDRCREARRHCDALVVVAHGGKEYAPVPPPYWFDQLLAVAVSGADAVIGHHPHVPQGLTLVERSGKRPVPIVFSTGNFVFPPRPATPVMSAWMGLGYLVDLCLDCEGVTELNLLPYRIAPPKGVTGLRPETMHRFLTFMRSLSEPLTDRNEIETWFDDSADYFWTHQWLERVEGLTAKLCRDDPAGLRHGRSHFEMRAHSCLIARVIQRKIEGHFGDTPPERLAVLQSWFAGQWPVDPALSESASP